MIEKSAFVFLQNLQDCKANNLRHVSYTDDLQRNTQTPTENNDGYLSDHDNDEEEIASELQLNNLAELSLDMDRYIIDTTEISNETFHVIPPNFSCHTLREKGLASKWI